MASTGRVLWADTHLRTLISYWDWHKTDFQDPATRSAAFEGTAQAIRDECDIMITSRQVQGKFEKMWIRQRAEEYINHPNGFAEMFAIGPHCLDLGKLGLGSLTLAAKNATQGISETMQKLDLCNNAAESQLTPELSSSDTPERSDKLQLEEIQRLQQELRNKDDEIRRLNEAQFIHTGLSSRGLQARGPLDKQVLKIIDHLINLIGQNVCSFMYGDLEDATFISFSEMKARHQPLYELHQQVYGIDFEDVLSIVHLRSLGIPEVGNVDMLRALMGMNILQVVLRSSFPDFFHDRGSVALIYEEIIQNQFGQIAQSIFLQSAQYQYVKDPIFSGKIVPAAAKILSQSLHDILWPMQRTSQNKLTSLNLHIAPKDVWKTQEQTLQEIFEQALTLRAELWLNPDKYRFFWPQPNSAFNRTEIRGDDDESIGHRADNSRVLITLFPGVAAWDPESITRNGCIDDDTKDGRRVVVKALCLLH